MSVKGAVHAAGCLYGLRERRDQAGTAGQQVESMCGRVDVFVCVCPLTHLYSVGGRNIPFLIKTASPPLWLQVGKCLHHFKPLALF